VQDFEEGPMPMSDEREFDNNAPGYDEETDRLFDEYLRTASSRGDFAIPKMRITRPSGISEDLRSDLIMTMRRAHAERQVLERAAKCRSFGDFFKYLKQARNLNWNRIAESLSIPTDEIGKIERNELHPTDLPFELHKALTTLFNIPIGYYMKVMSHLLLVEAESAAASGGLQFARSDKKGGHSANDLLEAWCASAPEPARERLNRFKSLIGSIENQISRDESEAAEWGA
jgi:hypothetical protein